MTSTWETACLYHLVHALAVFAVAIAASPQDRPLRIAAWAWTVGVLLFSGSLYVLALGGPRWLGPVTPLGGLAFLVGWSAVIFSARRTSPAA